MTGFAGSDLIGLLGAALIVSAYLFLQLGSIKAESVSFSVINALGAAGIIVSLFYDFNLSAMVIEVFWLAISLFGIARSVRLRRLAASDASEETNP